MVLSPQMRQSIKLLSMSTKDLNEYIDAAIEANPFLAKVFERKMSERHRVSTSPSPAANVTYEYGEQNVEQKEDMRSSLLSQIRMLNIEGKYLEIAEYLISEMDDNGYINTVPADAASDLSVSVEDVEDCLAVIQSLEPAGIGARGVAECLKLQLKRVGKEDSLEYAIVNNFITELAREDVAKIAKALRADKDSIQAAINNIKKLNPRPMSNMLSEKPEPVNPDLIASFKNKKVRLELNRDWLPRLRFYNPYEDKLDIIKDENARKFLKENMDAAKNLIDNLKRREETMCKVAAYILNYHQNELVNEVDEIKSLTIKEIADVLGLHASTINRAVSNKYIQLDDKVLSLKSLLSHGIKKENGEITSKIAVKKKINELVKNEDKKKPLSDKAIQEKLKLEGIMIERRTITKYRTALRILPTYLRKKA